MRNSTDKRGYNVIVTGLVQNVGFRYFTCKEAEKLNIAGYAKNLSNGTVEVQMFGEQEHLHCFLKWLEKGPKTAVVESIAVSKIAFRQEERFLSL